MSDTQNESSKYDCLLLKNQLCFPLYAASREILRKYTPVLKELDLTYTQYIVMMVLWEEKELKVTELGSRLFLDTGTLSPLLKSMEKKNLLCRTRSKNDERIVMVAITPEGAALKDKALAVPQKMASCVKLSKEETDFLYKILYKIIG
ncbi:MAG: MarR family transcriptional regulator [Treponema sp.]|nr:MarR family transcriptional regulator [Treponema sp.]